MRLRMLLFGAGLLAVVGGCSGGGEVDTPAPSPLLTAQPSAPPNLVPPASSRTPSSTASTAPNNGGGLQASALPSTNAIAQTAVTGNGSTPSPGQVPQVSATEPPVAGGLSLVILDPPDGTVVNTKTITIRGKTSPDAVVTVDDDLVGVDASGGFSKPVVLEPGPNVFTVIASDEDGNQQTIELTIGYAP